MREFFYKNSFIRFYSAVTHGRMNFKGDGRAAMLICAIVMCVGMIFNASLAANPIIMLLAALAIPLFILCFGFGARLRVTPNFASVIPISHRKKTAWFMLSPVFAIVIGVILGILILLIICAMSCAITAASGKSVSELINEEDWQLICQAGGLGCVFTAIYLVICYSVGLISGLIKRKLYRNLTITAFLTINTLFMLITNCATATETEQGGYLSASPFLAQSYANIHDLWIMLPFLGVIAAVLLGFAIYLCQNRFRVDKY